ncbi:MAG: BrnT family toxin [Elusimicrobiaceae bacterium]|nr:BrnT family toxin [Elusimicrobiaceae bacterium]
MKDIHFEWDAKKNIINMKKHKVSFEEAKNETKCYGDNL